MKRVLYLATAMSGLLSVCGPSNAADPVTDTGYDWSGLYIGGQVGAQFLDGSVEDPGGVGFTTGEYDDTGFIYGGFLGLNHQFDSIVIGVEADLEGTTTDDTSSRFGFGANTDVRGTADIDLQGSLRARLGYAADNMLIYVTGGYAWASADFDYLYDAAPVADDSFSETLSGWTVGGGVEYGWDAWSTRLEYRYTDYGKASSGIADCCAGPPNGQDHDLNTHSIRLGVAYRF
jgi:outer membrane immunogenic protein